MPNTQIINIDAEFDGLEFDETAINKATGNKIGGVTRTQQWATDTTRRKQASENAKQLNNELYGGYKWIVCSPGNDMLDYYDKQNELLGEDNRAHSVIPPSVVFHYRFEHDMPKKHLYPYLRDNLRKYKVTSDLTYWAQVYKTRYNWLVNKPHEEWAFDKRIEMENFLRDQFPQQKGFSLELNVHHAVTGAKPITKMNSMFWRGNLKGWSIHIVTIDEYNKFVKKANA